MWWITTTPPNESVSPGRATYASISSPLWPAIITVSAVSDSFISGFSLCKRPGLSLTFRGNSRVRTKPCLTAILLVKMQVGRDDERWSFRGSGGADIWGKALFDEFGLLWTGTHISRCRLCARLVRQ